MLRPVPSVHETRALIAQTLAKHYHELSGTIDKPAPRFSLARMLSAMCSNRPIDGYEAEVLQGAALISGQPFDVFRPVVPWGALVERAMLPSPGSKGGYLIDTDATTASAALAPWSVTARAGAMIFENLTTNISVPRIATAPSGAWLPNTVTSSDPVLGSVSLVERTYLAVTDFSLQFLRQAAQSEPFLRRMLLAKAGRILDGATFAGAGGAEPLGLLNQGLPSASGTSFAWSTATGILKTLGDAGVDDGRATFVASPSARKLLQERAKAASTSDFVWDSNDKIANRNAYSTPDMTGAAMVAGDFGALAVGLWGNGVEIQVDPDQHFDLGVGSVRVQLHCDVAALQPAAFVVVAAVT